MIHNGTHHGLRPKDYHAWAFDPKNPGDGPLSTSLLKRYVALGPPRFLASLSEERKPSAAMAWGSLVDCLLFTPEFQSEEFVEKESNPHLSSDGVARTKKAREWVAEKEAEGSRLISVKDYAKAAIAVAQIQQTPVSARLLEGAQTQVAAVHSAGFKYSVGPETAKGKERSGIPVKGLIDIVCADGESLGDLKTTGVNLYSADELSRQVGRFGYHVQAAMYLYLWNKATGEDRTAFKIIWQSSAPPYEVRVTEIDNLSLAAGRAYVQFHLPRMIRDCKDRSSLQWSSTFAHAETTLPMHSPSVFAEEATAELLTGLE